MAKLQSNCLICPFFVDLQSINKNITVNDSIQDKLCYSTSGESSIEELLISNEEEVISEISKNQHKITNYVSEKDIAYSSRGNILTWATKLLDAITLTHKQKQSIFHRFSTAYDLINEKLFIEKHPLQEDKLFKKIMVSLFLIVYKLEGYTIGKITIQSLIEAFLNKMRISDSDIKKTELRILKIFNYNSISFENNLQNLTFILIEIIKKKYNLSIEFSCMIEKHVDKMNRIIQFSDKLVFDIYPIDKAAISVFAVIIFLKNNFQKNKYELYTYRLITSEMALLTNNLYTYFKTVLKVIVISQIDFKHYSSLYSEMIKLE